MQTGVFAIPPEDKASNCSSKCQPFNYYRVLLVLMLPSLLLVLLLFLLEVEGVPGQQTRFRPRVYEVASEYRGLETNRPRYGSDTGSY